MMVPAVVPLPVPAKRPFQFESGIQTSNWMFDCDVGLMVPATRQKGGRLAITRGVKAGGTATFIEPEVSSRASVIVVSGKASSARLAHDRAD
jgi:hypothetical protein